MAITRRSHKAAGAGQAGGPRHGASSSASLRAALARLSLSSWVGLAAFIFMAVLSVLGTPRGGMGGYNAAFSSASTLSSFLLASPTSRRAQAPKPLSKPCASTQLSPWPLGVEFAKAKSDAGIKCLEYAYTVR